MDPDVKLLADAIAEEAGWEIGDNADYRMAVETAELCISVLVKNGRLGYHE